MRISIIAYLYFVLKRFFFLESTVTVLGFSIFSYFLCGAIITVVKFQRKNFMEMKIP